MACNSTRITLLSAQQHYLPLQKASRAVALLQINILCQGHGRFFGNYLWDLAHWSAAEDSEDMCRKLDLVHQVVQPYYFPSRYMFDTLKATRAKLSCMVNRKMHVLLPCLAGELSLHFRAASTGPVRRITNKVPPALCATRLSCNTTTCAYLFSCINEPTSMIGSIPRSHLSA